MILYSGYRPHTVTVTVTLTVTVLGSPTYGRPGLAVAGVTVTRAASHARAAVIARLPGLVTMPWQSP